jgi:V-type H+-transporting ATPase subunit d
MSELSLFNVQNGFTEALVRGLRSGFLTQEDYRRIGACDTLEDVRSALEETDYGSFLQDEPSPILVSTIAKKCYEKLADEFNFLKAQTTEPLTSFLDFMQREKMIDNVIMIIQCALNNKAPNEMLDKIHPMGVFDSMKDVMKESFDVQGGFEDVYRVFLIDTPIGKYFEDYLKEAGSDGNGPLATIDTMPGKSDVGRILNNQDLEIMKAMLKKAWLEDFYQFVQKQGGTTEEIMGHILKMEADFRLLLVAINSLNTDLSSSSEKLEQRNELFPTIGYLYPEGYKALKNANSDQAFRTALEPFADYMKLYDEVKDFYNQDKQGSGPQGMRSIEDVIYKDNAFQYEMAFEQQFHFGVFYAWVKLREQEIRNLRWICNMIVLNTKDQINSTIVDIFQQRM